MSPAGAEHAGTLDLQHSHVRRLRRLVGRRSRRDQERSFVVEGPRVLAEAADVGAPVEVFCEPGCDDPVIDAVLARGGRVRTLAPGVLAKVTDTVTPQGMVAITAYRDVSISEVVAAAGDDPGPIVVLAGISDPGNAGTIMRSAEAAGAAGVVFCDGSVDPYNPKAVRASAGAVFHVPHVRGAVLGEVVDALRGDGWTLVGAAAHGGCAPSSLLSTSRLALVMGNEAHGLPDAAVASLDATVTIPVRGRAESLNVAMATSALLLSAAGLLGPEGARVES